MLERRPEARLKPAGRSHAAPLRRLKPPPDGEPAEGRQPNGNPTGWRRERCRSGAFASSPAAGPRSLNWRARSSTRSTAGLTDAVRTRPQGPRGQAALLRAAGPGGGRVAGTEEAAAVGSGGAVRPSGSPARTLTPPRRRVGRCLGQSNQDELCRQGAASRGGRLLVARTACPSELGASIGHCWGIVRLVSRAGAPHRAASGNGVSVPACPATAHRPWQRR